MPRRGASRGRIWRVRVSDVCLPDDVIAWRTRLSDVMMRAVQRCPVRKVRWTFFGLILLLGMTACVGDSWSETDYQEKVANAAEAARSSVQTAKLVVKAADCSPMYRRSSEIMLPGRVRCCPLFRLRRCPPVAGAGQSAAGRAGPPPALP